MRGVDDVLKDASSGLRELAALSPDPIILLDTAGVFRYVSPGVEPILGRPPEDVVDTSFLDLVDPSSLDEAVAAFARAAEGETVRGLEVMVHDAAGDAVYVEVSATAAEGSDGEAYVYGIVRDVTERHEREHELRRFREAVEQAGTAIYITDREGRIEYVNPAFERITGYDSAEAVGATPNLLHSGEHDEAFFEELWETIEAGRVWEDLIVDKRKSGEQYSAIQTVAPIPDDDGAITGYVAIQTDVTDRQLADQRLSVLNRLLRHNLRNGLGVVMGHIQDVQRRFPDDEAVQAACRTCLEQCETLLTESKKARDLQELLDRDNATPRRVGAVLERLEAVTEDRPGVTLSVPARPPPDWAIPDLVEVALVELVENACEHGESPNIRVEVAPTGENSLQFTVVDDGPGIPEDERMVLERGMETPMAHSKGFGLWKAYWLVRAAGGTLSFDDERSDGSAITVRVPRATPPANDQPSD